MSKDETVLLIQQVKTAVPKGWSIGFCVDDHKYYFVRLRLPGRFARIKPDNWKKWIKTHGELDVAKYLIVDGIKYVPYPKRDAVSFRKVVIEENNIRRVIGGWLA